MLGAVLGDIIGSYYEWNNVKTKQFPLVTPYTKFTDDSVMTLAVAKWLIDDPTHSEEKLVECMQSLGRAHATAGYGGTFAKWLMNPNPQPYNSWGNGSAMRVSPVGLYASSEEEALRLARTTALVTHNHPEGIKGAESVALAVFLNKQNALCPLESRKALTKAYVEEHFGYDLSRTLDEIRPGYRFDVSCQGSVPEAIIAYLESESVEDCVRNAISIGGDSDTIAAIACSIFMAGESSQKEANAWTRDFGRFLTTDLRSIMEDFEQMLAEPAADRRERAAKAAARLAAKQAVQRFTPENITSLAADEIFVFGSNLAGAHSGGAARVAHDKFGAIWGQGEGLQGQSYAIPTMLGGVEHIKPYVDAFIRFARANGYFTFLVTRIGCGIAGYSAREIAPLFRDALGVKNIVLPKEFVDVLCGA